MISLSLSQINSATQISQPIYLSKEIVLGCNPSAEQAA